MIDRYVQSVYHKSQMQRRILTNSVIHGINAAKSASNRSQMSALLR